MEYDKRRIVEYFKREVFDCYLFEDSDKAWDIYRKVLIGEMSYEDAWDEMDKMMGTKSAHRKEVLKDPDEKPLINWKKFVHKGVEVSALPPDEKEKTIKELKEAFSKKIYDLVWSQDEVKESIRLQYDILQLSKLFLMKFPERTVELLKLEMDKVFKLEKDKVHKVHKVHKDYRYEIRGFLMDNLQSKNKSEYLN